LFKESVPLLSGTAHGPAAETLAAEKLAAKTAVA
jgi:hypothetical protein